MKVNIPKNWFLSDSHFDHANIIKYCHRPYKDTTQMNIDINQVNGSVIRVWVSGHYE